MSLSKRKRKILRLIIPLFVLILIGYTAWKFYQGAQSRKVAGIYLTTGGETFLIIESNLWGSLKVTDGGLHITEYITASPDRKFSVKLKKNHLYFSQEEIDKSGYTGDGYYHTAINMILKPSLTIAGDWDLVRSEILINEIPKDRIFGKRFFEDIWHSGSIARFEETLKSYLEKRDSQKEKRHYSEKPVPSILHRMDDPGIAEYFHARQKGLIDYKSLQVVRDIHDKFPEDPYLALHHIEMEALSGNPSESLELWEKWKECYRSHPDAYLRSLAERAFVTITVEMNKKKLPDQINPSVFFYINHDYPKDAHDFEDTLKRFKEFYHSDQIFFFSFPIVPHLDVPGFFGWWNLNFLQLQTTSKMLSVHSIFYLFQGKREESLEILASIYRMGQAFNSHGSVIQRLIGIAIRAIASDGLRIFVLNACETQEEFKQCWNTLERLNNTPNLEDGSHIMSGESPLLYSLIMPHNYLESETRHKVSDMKFELSRMACAAKYRLLLSGDFPSEEEDFAPFLSRGLPRDIFTKKDSLRFENLSPNELTIYSVGPDRKDDHAAIAYDPTNGTNAPGDIFITIP
ncbi:hypothetical protein JW926_10940, partial [Candidatus Sumerlaeota bacterium]|nr:hypothetical protein [Candidatus Sumerlaeota bacterium]